MAAEPPFRFVELWGRYVAQGGRAQRRLMSSDVSSLFVFSVPGYRLLPSATDARFDAVYAYSLANLSRMDWETANMGNAILVDQSFTFTCLCSHEVGSMAQVQFFAA
jgi:hypothetical protein